MSDLSETPRPVGPDGRPLGPDGRPLPGPQQMQQVMAQKRMAQQQAQVDEVVGIMRNNVEKVLERDQKLSELDERADALQDGASQFEKQAGKLKNKFWMQNMKWIIIMCIVGLIFLILIYFKMSEDDHAPPHPGTYSGGGHGNMPVGMREPGEKVLETHEPVEKPDTGGNKEVAGKETTEKLVTISTTTVFH